MLRYARTANISSVSKPPSILTISPPKDCPLPAGFTLELNGDVFDAEFFQALFEFRHHAIIGGNFLISGENVGAERNVTRANAPDMQVVNIFHAVHACHALPDFLHGEMFGDAFDQDVQ
ncbi:MAG: hypothetical protein Fur0016_06390 [Anaerolineales bacterium]